MLGDRVRDGGIEYEVVWCGASARAGVVAPLCSFDRQMGSTLDPLVREQYAFEMRGHNRRRDEGYKLTIRGMRRARRELRGFTVRRGGR